MFIYNLIVRLYALVILIASVKKTKAKQWVAGRKNWRSELKKEADKLQMQKRIWVHCASYGEFEQGRPLIEAIKKKHPDYVIVLSFFSPSGYEAFKNWDGADLICYLPLDTRSNAKDFIEIIKPKTVVFIKYEFWLNFLFRLQKLKIPTFLVSAVFKAHHPFFRWYGSIFRRSLKTFTELFIQDEASAKLLESIGITNFEICGDTRFDRVVEIKNNFDSITFFEEFCKNKKVIVAGSTWSKDEELLIKVFQKLNYPDLKLIFAPHNIDSKSIQNLEQLLSKNKIPYQLYSQQKVDNSKNILIVNAMGLLNKLYHYANVTYIGGGFNSGIHNCLEPAVYLKPVVFYGGDDFHKYNEAIDLLEMKAAKNVSNESEAQQAFLHFLNDTNEIKIVEEKLKSYFDKNSGTTEKVMGYIKWSH
ncbi:3-deoxy-D-manno-octulosonic acid transferase [Aurantibacillus circumpalustris]|uniref:3-deoxy-D-manno-octulosonic acid transferase n=1 Tax=Aurantibacillus circumpalustris TaxID=3036359 RepID=UPI00295C2FF1|nr:glycosyltransferase N-terminal domain-containing protein [Aurantibacillus circumpalustris]